MIIEKLNRVESRGTANLDENSALEAQQRNERSSKTDHEDRPLADTVLLTSDEHIQSNAAQSANVQQDIFA